MSSKAALKRLSSLPTVQKQFNAFTYINHKCHERLSQGSSADDEKPLKNILCGIKDNIATKELPTSCGSKILKDFQSPFNATVVDLLEGAGAVTVGKTNMDEFGMGSGGTHSHFGPTRNPQFPSDNVIAGGSSSGSAAAVAADVVDFAIGTDTGGSVRLPAAYTSVMGFKPSYGRISRHGVVAYAQSLDTVGILAKDIDIVQQVFKVLDKYDWKDPTSLDEISREKLAKLHCSKTKLKIGIPQEFLQAEIPADLQEALLRAITKLESKGHEIYPVSIPTIKNALPTYYTLAPAEAVSNLSRYDGLRYGYRDSKADSEHGTLFAPTRNEFGEEVKNRIVLGNYNLCSESFDNHYIKAQKLRVQLIDEFDEVFAFPNVLTEALAPKNGVDVLVCLSAITLPTSISAYDQNCGGNPIKSYVNDVFTTPMSLAGLPTISIPDKHAQSVGIQLFGQYGDDLTVLDAARSIM